MEQAHMSDVRFCLHFAIIIIHKPRVAENLCALRSSKKKQERQCKPDVVSFLEILQAQQ